MTETKNNIFMPSYSIWVVEFKVVELKIQVRFYEDVVGLVVVKRESDKVYFAGEGDSEPLLILNKVATEYQEQHTTGIFHIAFLLSSREALATKFLISTSSMLPGLKIIKSIW